MILLIDNYDSFVYNLARYFRRLGQQVRVVRNDAVQIAEIRAMRPAAIVLSPGPRTPTEAGVSLEIVRSFSPDIPILGVCLGHQAIAVACGAELCRAPEPVHGRTSRVTHDGKGIFQGIPSPLVVCRYHSLVVEPATIPPCLEVTAWTEQGLVMGLRHRDRPTIGVQFHPESILTDLGYNLLAKFLQLAGIATTADLPGIDDELPIIAPDVVYTELAGRPVTF